MKQALRQSRKRYSNMLLNRIVKGNPLWGPLESTPLDSLQAELSAKKDSNLQLCEFKYVAQSYSLHDMVLWVIYWCKFLYKPVIGK